MGAAGFSAGAGAGFPPELGIPRFTDSRSVAKFLSDSLVVSGIVGDSFRSGGCTICGTICATFERCGGSNDTSIAAGAFFTFVPVE